MPEINNFYKHNNYSPKINFDFSTKAVNSIFILRLLFNVLICVIFVTLIIGCNADQNLNSPSRNSEQSDTISKLPERIISTTPAITELLFEIGLGDKIVGDSQFTVYPPEAAKIEKIGGLVDRNNEKIISLHPDLIIFPIEDIQFKQKLLQWKIRHLAVDHRSISGLLDSYEQAGNIFGGKYLTKSIEKRKEFEAFLQDCKSQVKNLKRVRTLIVIDRQHGTGRIENVFIAGAELFFSEILNLAGGENAVSNVDIQYPKISGEAIIDFKPDAIIEIQTMPENNKFIEQNSRSDWNTLKDVVPAVKNNKVFIITDDYAAVPGPRTPLIIKKIRSILDECRKNL
ncbi:MAG: ABC transporter substrate-binding protein [Planctomycetaceae bacterium]|jgi:iron complex transport system substrate-binding protein|nr:ABC transporter substrate-binding protein [Planctomycetaceae bacterium]